MFRRGLNKCLPINLNRISWKRLGKCCHKRQTNKNGLPINLNRISWKHWDTTIWRIFERAYYGCLPINLNRISWKQVVVGFRILERLINQVYRLT